MITYSEYEQTAINVALTAIQQTLVTDNVLSSFVQVENYLKLHLADEPDEWFGVMFLTSQHRLIRFDKLFRGTVNASYVHIRVIARKALELNAAAVILAHNHPSGMCEPSSADQDITVKIKDALKVFDINVLDHLIVTKEDVCSYPSRIGVASLRIASLICVPSPAFRNKLTILQHRSDEHILLLRLLLLKLGEAFEF